MKKESVDLYSKIFLLKSFLNDVKLSRSQKDNVEEIIDSFFSRGNVRPLSRELAAQILIEIYENRLKLHKSLDF